MNVPAVDLHCHLDLYPDPTGVVHACHDLGAYVLSVTTTPKAWRGTSRLASGRRRIKTALGLHPQLAAERIGELPLFDALLPETRYIGEVGLDGSPECRPHWLQQVQVFEHVLRSASNQGGRIITIHSRSAASDVLDALARHPDAGVPVLHWFSGSRAELRRAVDMNCWFTVGPAMLRGRRGRELLAEMPRDRVMTETDGPFATLDDRPLKPAETASALAEIGSIWGMTSDAVAGVVLENFRRLVSVRVGGADPSTAASAA